MSSRASYSSSSYTQDKGAYGQRSSSPRSLTSNSSTSTNSAQSSRSGRFSKPPVIHNGGGQSDDPNTSTSVSNSGYYN
ncbi:hypothetical protein B0J11DRAFT_579299 [Dendryphion nanum]|uniref:Uncharacterized protein n=1 Tax=Dendryphion nanum TaxID=256645 RepID=A0A9P9DX77_9PLEO|nr:hypothetical protein B0J11DRAFT_579299 [Dendryphion nanum]